MVPLLAIKYAFLCGTEGVVPLISNPPIHRIVLWCLNHVMDNIGQKEAIANLLQLSVHQKMTKDKAC